MLNLTRWMTRHRRLVVCSWIVIAVGALVASQAVGRRVTNNYSLPNTDSQRAVDLLKGSFPSQAGDTDQIVFHARTATLDQPSARAAIAPMLQRVAMLPHVAAVESPYAAGAHAISRDRTVAFATVSFDQRANKLPKSAIERVISTAEAAQSSTLQVELGGQAIKQAEKAGLGFVTVVGIGAAILVLLISFGSFLAMGLPIVTALLGLGAGLGLIGLVSHLVDMVDFSADLALMIGLGVGIDYALFVVTRFRDAYRENGGNVQAAVEQAMNTAGRAILFAGATVVVALLGMFAVGVPVFYGAAIAASLGVLLVLFTSVTLLPALLTSFGERIGSRRTRPSRPTNSESGFWTRWVGLIQRQPVLAALGATALLLVFAAPALGLRLAASDAGNDPTSQTTRKAYDLLAGGFGAGFNGPLQLAVQLPRDRSQAALARLTGTLNATPGIASVAKPRMNEAGNTAAIAVYPASSPQSAQTTSLVKHLRNQVLPPVAKDTGATVYIGGATATQVDFAHVVSKKLPLFIGIVVAVSALLLLLVFRSLVIPLQAALMNLLSILAALGVTQAIFERGWLGGLLGIQPGPIESFLPVMVFAIVFGLSMDYEVFLVSRIHEEWQHRGDNTVAVREGLVRTGRVITSAAAVMIVVFASFAAADDRVLKLLGVSMATAVLLDALVIRTILLPAVLQLTGRHTWALPNWLRRRLPRLAIELEADGHQLEPALDEAA
jgi:putative drug exporter of the RND superfamily